MKLKSFIIKILQSLKYTIILGYEEDRHVYDIYIKDYNSKDLFHEFTIYNN